MLDRRRPNYQTLYAHLRLLVRFTLAFTMLSYGFAKLYPLQFVPPFMTTLTETYGESSPMGILWTFMGASAAYTRFCGMAEVTAGLLLLFRRTTVVGALVATGAMLNVAALNFCYDVPVKLYSVHLVLMSIFLLIPESMALMRFFFTRQAAELERAPLPRFNAAGCGSPRLYCKSASLPRCSITISGADISLSKRPITLTLNTRLFSASGTPTLLPAEYGQRPLA